MNLESIGKLLLGIGITALVAGGLMLLLSKIGLQKLPGDIVFKKGNFTFVFPIVTCIVLSLLLTLVSYIISRFK